MCIISFDEQPHLADQFVFLHFFSLLLCFFFATFERSPYGLQSWQYAYYVFNVSLLLLSFTLWKSFLFNGWKKENNNQQPLNINRQQLFVTDAKNIFDAMNYAFVIKCVIITSISDDQTVIPLKLYQPTYVLFAKWINN